jgi:hypothetical protein
MVIARVSTRSQAAKGKRSGRIVVRDPGGGAVQPGGDEHGERGDGLLALLAAHRRGGDPLHAHRRWPARGLMSWWWHGGERPVPRGSLTLVKVRVQGPGLTAARTRLPGRVAGDGTRGAQPRGVRRTARARGRRWRCRVNARDVPPVRRTRSGTGWATGVSSAFRGMPPPSPATRESAAPHRSSIDPPGDISLGPHRKARMGRCQHA